MDRNQRQYNNYNNSVSFLQENPSPTMEIKNPTDPVAQLDIATLSARQINQATASGMSWADKVRMLESPTIVATQNNTLISNTTTVNQQINQIVMQHQEETPGSNSTTDSFPTTPNGNTKKIQEVKENSK